MFLIVVMFIGWLLSYISYALLPFVLAFFIAYIFDPVVTRITGKYFPRWLAALLIMGLFIGIVSMVAVFIFPSIFSQLNDASKKIASIVTTVTTYLETRKITQVYDVLGIKDENLRKIIKQEFLPEIKDFLSGIFNSLLNLVKGVSVVASQILNAIVIPILAFYFLKDFDKIKGQIKFLLGKKNQKLLTDLKRTNEIFKVYIGWQLISASMVATVCSVSFLIGNVQYPFLLGMICGILNPIPYLGLLSSMVICSLTILIAAPPDMWQEILIIVITILSWHTINAYLIEPNVLRRRVGVHPIMLFASLYVFGALFGIVGMLIAVPCTATMMLFFNDWNDKLKMERNLAETDNINIVNE